MMSFLTEIILVSVPREISKYPFAVIGLTSDRTIIKYSNLFLSDSEAFRNFS